MKRGDYVINKSNGNRYKILNISKNGNYVYLSNGYNDAFLHSSFSVELDDVYNRNKAIDRILK